MLETLFPRPADNRYPGHRLGLWLFSLMPVKALMGLNVMVNAPVVAQSADGIGLSAFDPNARSAFLFMFAAWGLGQVLLGLASLLVLLRYRSLVPLAFLALLLEQVGRGLLHLRWPVAHAGGSPGATLNGVLLGILLLGFALSLRRPGVRRAGGQALTPPFG